MEDYFIGQAEMLEKPPVSDDKLIYCLVNHYALRVKTLEFLPLGYDSSSAVYSLTTHDDVQYFLKLKSGDFYEASVDVPVYLNQHIAEIVAPIKSIDDKYWHQLDDFALVLFPFIEGENGMTVGLSDAQQQDFGRILKTIHETVLPDTLKHIIRHEEFSFRPSWLGAIRQVHEEILNTHYVNPYRQDLAQFWRNKHDEIGAILHRALEIADMLKNRSFDFVVCHSDIHTANLMINAQGKLHVIDWDNPILAPKERDLMFTLSHPMDKPNEGQRSFAQGYGMPEIDPYALLYYRYEWVIQEIGEFAELVFLADDVGDTTRADVVAEFKQLFEKGDVIEGAYHADVYIQSLN